MDYIANEIERRKEAVKLGRLNAKKVAEAIREDLKIRGMTQYDLAKETGISQANISSTLKGKHIPTIKTLLRIGGVFKRIQVRPSPEKSELKPE